LVVTVEEQTADGVHVSVLLCADEETGVVAVTILLGAEVPAELTATIS
jgi:hypothetical protein